MDRTPGANPIRQVLDNLNEAGSMYGAIIYQKAPIVMRHLEALLGEDNFARPARVPEGARVRERDLDRSDRGARRRTPMDLQAWSRVWVEQPGRPTIETELDVDERRITRLAFRQRDPWNRDLVWPQQLRVAHRRHADRTRQQRQRRR